MRLVSAWTVVVALLPLVTEASRLNPPVLPLIVRNPYLSTWLSNARDAPWERWPMFWTGQEIGFSVLASVPSERSVYPLLGRPQDSLPRDDDSFNVSSAIYLGNNYDASTTNLSYTLPLSASNPGSIEITISFLSPITPTSTVRQSVPASYVSVHVEGTEDVDIYIDLNGQWVSGNRGSEITWTLRRTSLGEPAVGRPPMDVNTWQVQRQTEQLFTEFQDRAEWGQLHFSAPAEVRYESGTSAELRQRFARTGTLQNQIDPHFRSIMDDEPVFAFAKSFHMNESQSQSVLFTIAHVQDPVVQFASARGLTLMRPLWKSYFPTTQKLLTFHYLDVHHAKSLAHEYSSQLAAGAFLSGADDYQDIVALSARQVIGATSFSGTPDNPILFLKEISSNGNFQTIDVIFPSFPFFLYTNARWLAYLLEPLIEHMLSGQYPNKYAMHDLGAHFPNATGHPLGRDEYMPVEECGNILIMGLALVNSMRQEAKFSVSSTWQPMNVPESSIDGIFPLTTGRDGDMLYLDEPWSGREQSEKGAEKWVERGYRLWKQWTSYLVEYSLLPANQLSTDDFAGWLALQTNLALKGIIGIKAMASLSAITGYDEDVKYYNNVSKVYIEKWEEYGISRDKTHAKVSYDWYGSWSTTYNLYADSLLCFHLGIATNESQSTIGGHHDDKQKPLKGIKGDYDGFVPKHIYQLQSDWYYAVRQKFGLPLDSRHLYTKTDWEFFAMAVAAPKVRAEILQSVAHWINETDTDRPLTDLHMTEGRGGFPGPNFFARPVIGGHFAFLTLKEACGGKAMDGLKFLDDSVTKKLDVKAILQAEMAEAGLDEL